MPWDQEDYFPTRSLVLADRPLYSLWIQQKPANLLQFLLPAVREKLKSSDLGMHPQMRDLYKFGNPDVRFQCSTEKNLDAMEMIREIFPVPTLPQGKIAWGWNSQCRHLTNGKRRMVSECLVTLAVQDTGGEYHLCTAAPRILR